YHLTLPSHMSVHHPLSSCIYTYSYYFTPTYTLFLYFFFLIIRPPPTSTLFPYTTLLPISHRHQRERLVRLHELVNRLAVLDGVLGLESGDHGHPAPDHADPQRPARGGLEGGAFREPRGDIEQHRHEQ